jgi:hypothetical protein
MRAPHAHGQASKQVYTAINYRTRPYSSAAVVIAFARKQRQHSRRMQQIGGFQWQIGC